MFTMKQILITTIAAVLLVGCGRSVDIHEAAKTGNIKAVKQHLAGGVDVNVKNRMDRLLYIVRFLTIAGKSSTYSSLMVRM